MLKHRNAKKALLDIIEELQRSQNNIEEKKSVSIGDIPDDRTIPTTSISGIFRQQCMEFIKSWEHHGALVARREILLAQLV